MARSRQTEHYLKRQKALESERSTMMDTWRDLSDQFLGFRGRFLAGDRNKVKRNRNIPNNTGRLAARTLASGMMAGITSPARPWFKLGTLDPELVEYAPVKYWLHDVEMKMREVFAQSNLYNALHSLYGEIGTFGTAAMGLYFNYSNVIRAANYTVGSYSIATDEDGVVNTLYRVYQSSVGQVVSKFGKENVSRSVLDNYSRGNTESMVDILHVIEPNTDADGMPKTGMPWRSVYLELRRMDDGFLRVKGFEEFPIMAPRWDLAGDDTYATNCPGMDALGDNRALQLHERRKSQALDKVVDPPMQAPLSMQHQLTGSFQPGDIEFVSDTSNGIRSVYDFRPDLGAQLEITREDEFRVKRAYYEDLFLMLANSDRRQVTAREIEEKHEEKLLQLGPVLERLHSELLNPLIKRTFKIMLRSQILPPPPPELEKTDLNVEYISVLAQAQRLTAVSGIERLMTYALNVSQVWPDARHKFNAEQSIDDYAQAVGTPPRMIRDDKEVESIKQAEQQRAQAAQMAEMAPNVAQSAKALSETDVESVSALTRAMGLA